MTVDPTVIVAAPATVSTTAATTTATTTATTPTTASTIAPTIAIATATATATAARNSTPPAFPASAADTAEVQNTDAKWCPHQKTEAAPDTRGTSEQ